MGRIKKAFLYCFLFFFI